MVNHAVVAQLKRKENEGYTVVHLGPELKYVGAQQNSNTHNLEEQLILGTDKETTITNSVTPDGTRMQRVEETKYKTDDSDENYYILNKTTQMELAAQINENENKLIINLNPKILSETETLTFYVDENTTVASSTKTGAYSYSGNTATVTESVAEDTQG